MFPRETFFLARAYPSVRPSVFRRWVFFFICDRLNDGNGIYRRLVYQRTVSVGEASVFFSPTNFIAVTDGISSSIKLDNASIVVGSSFSTIYITLLLFIYSMWDMVSNIHYNYYKYCHKGTSNNEL